jgi:hypothetical protein
MRHCQVHSRKGTWIDFQKLVTPQIVDQYQWLILNIDDILLGPEFHVQEFLEVMDRHSINVAQPNVWNRRQSCFGGKLLQYRTYLEIQFTVFRPVAWRCWWKMLDPAVNAAGWGYDKCFSHLCPAVAALKQKAVIGSNEIGDHTFLVTHTAEPGYANASEAKSLYDHRGATDQMHAFFKQHHLKKSSCPAVMQAGANISAPHVKPGECRVVACRCCG